MQNKRFYTFFTLFVAIAILFTSMDTSFMAFADDDLVIDEVELDSKNKSLEEQLKDIDKKLKEEQAKEKEIKSKLSSAKGNVAEKQATVKYIDGQISITSNEIYLLQNKISLLEQDIEQKEEEIDAKQQEYDENFDVFAQRMRAMYMYDDSTTLGLILGTDNFFDLLTITDSVHRIAAHDEKLMAGLAEEKEELEEQKALLEDTKTSLGTNRELVESKKQQLSQQHSVAEAQVYELSTLAAQFEKELGESQKKSKAMQAEIDNIYAQLNFSDDEYAGGVMHWPVSGHRTISSNYGPRFGGSDYHTGVDITGSGVYGAPVLAANSGTVALTNWSYTPGYGYGIYVIVDHGGGITTLYAHMSNISVAKGDKVTRGQTIGAVGNTGWSTGPHLHFEVRVNKKHTNPMAYIT